MEIWKYGKSMQGVLKKRWKYGKSTQGVWKKRWKYDLQIANAALHREFFLPQLSMTQYTYMK